MENSSNPYGAPQSELDHPQSNAQLPYLKSWLVFMGLGTLVGIITGAVAGGIIGALLQTQSINLQIIRIAGGVGGFLINLPFSYLIFKWSVSKYLLKSQAG